MVDKFIVELHVRHPYALFADVFSHKHKEISSARRMYDRHQGWVTEWGIYEVRLFAYGVCVLKNEWKPEISAVRPSAGEGEACEA